jgi:WhiB family redox-sensing transcriptional regulator
VDAVNDDNWRTRAACQGMITKPEDDDPFHPPMGSGYVRPDRVMRAKAVCAGCPVRRDCLDFALRIERWEGVMPAVWGGLDPGERARLKTRRATA